MVNIKKKRQNSIFFALSASLAFLGCGTREQLETIKSPLSSLKDPFFKFEPSITSQLQKPTYFVWTSNNQKFLISEGDELKFRESGSFDLNGINGQDSILPNNSGNFSWKLITELTGSSGESTKKYDLFYDKLPIRGISYNRHTNYRGDISASGALSKVFLDKEFELREPGSFWLDYPSCKNKAAIYLNYSNELDWGQPSQIYAINTKNQLTPAWQITVPATLGGPPLPVEVLIDATSSEVINVKALAFSITGHATIFPENPVVSKTASLVELTGLQGTGTDLKSDTFRVFSCKEQTPSSQCDLNLIGNSGGEYTGVSYDQPEYDELVSYYAISKSVLWNTEMMNSPGIASGLRKDIWGNNRSALGLTTANPLTIFTRSLVKDSLGVPTYDNAQYLPGGITGQSNPSILIGTGWEPSQGLQPADRPLSYIGKDSDVVMHEFHHHIIFRTLTDTKATQTAAMHEGLADYFTYAITGNNKLGESIVPASYDNGQGSLRAGNMTGDISSYINSKPHISGEFWSSTLWDVRNALGKTNSKYKADKIIWDAVDLCSSSSTFYQFIVNMASSADAYATANGENPTTLRVAMFNVFAARGFINDPDTTGNVPGQSASLASNTVNQTSTAVNTETPTAVTASKRSTKSWCSVTSTGKTSIFNLLLLGMIIIVPYFTNRNRRQLR